MAFLELVARSAPRAEYDQLVARAERQGADENRLRHMERLNRLALTAHSLIEYRRDREAELLTLVDAAHEFAAARHHRDLLDAVPRRARLLLKAGVSYILADAEDGPGMVVESADGNATPLFVGLRVPAGSGLGGMVRARQAPFWTSDYLADPGIPHDDVIDEVIRAEGLRAVLGVPLRVGDHHLGVLFIADRQVRHLSPNEITLLGALADLAAATMEGIRLVEELRGDIRQLRANASSADAALAVARDSSRLQSDLIALLLDGSGLDALLRTAGEALGGGVGICGVRGEPLAEHGRLRRVGRADLHAACAGALSSGRPVRVADGFWLVALDPEAREAGFLMADAGGAAEHAVVPLLVVTSQAVALHLRMRRGDPAKDRYRQEFFDELVGALPSPELRRERALMFSLTFGRPHVVLVARGPGQVSEGFAACATAYARRLGGLRSVRDDAVVLLVPGDDPDAAAQDARRELSGRLNHPVTVGAAGPADTVDSVGEAYREAAQCMETLLALGGEGGTACASDLGFLGMLLAEDNDVPGYIEQVIGHVVDYDTDRYTDFVGTLRVYLESGRSPTRAAEILNVHPNTVSRRLERISQLLGEDWQTPDRVLDIQLALRLHQVRSALSGRQGAA
ncbi:MULTISPECIES: helix-turn-helix domain-containing protein [unclassified Streptomyces]|uniref:helix-turn-helix domain-containing protein n=1 Tax=unclassified Streptomyces TaxID=2593676 RepID=UPI0036FF2758